MPDQTPTVRTEKRRAKRQSLYIAATISLGADQGLACSIHDVSETGARIATARPESVPDRFTLLLTRHGFPRRECRVVWRREGLLGVAFEKCPAVSEQT
ncbi:MAG: PilZ domain-containing protein [Proteobacteria bacterium]|nr:PilZ domain-containing protein [Pseudomonadota bacterium]